METNSITIREYTPEHQVFFEKFNRQWIEQFFEMEPVDKMVLQNPQDNILKNGGTILMAYFGNEVAGTVALKHVTSDVYEFTKMAVDVPYRGKNIGRTLSLAAIEKAKQLKASSIILYSNTVLEAAISLYRSLGFIEIPLDGPYKRSNIKMKLDLNTLTKDNMISQSVNQFIIRDLKKLREEISLYKNEEKLWYKEKNIANPAGNLCLHLVGNLNTYIGVALGNSTYVRNRDLEFSQTGLSKDDLLNKIDATIEVVNNTLQNLPDHKLQENFPMKIFENETSTGHVLIHLSSHLGYHLGQINYHRRLLDSN